MNLCGKEVLPDLYLELSEEIIEFVRKRYCT